MTGVSRSLRALVGAVAWAALAAADSLFQRDGQAASQTAEQSLVYHPGYPAVHVTRLHRYDHSGLAAMVEEEARWERGDFGPSPRALSATVALASSANESARSFLQVSDKQASALAQHQWQELRQMSEKGGGADYRSRPRARSQRSFDYRSRLKPMSPDLPVATRLDSLDSQYVGPVGVGTVREPPLCGQGGGESLLFLDISQDEFNATSNGTAGCHVLNQAKIWVVFDTGSTNLWVSSDLCTTGPCARAGRRRFEHMVSDTFADPEHGAYLNVEFGTGKISGPLGIDDFHVGPFTVYQQPFGLIQTQEGKVFDEVPFEGILGLAFPKMSANGVRAFFDNIIAQKALNKNEFSFYFSKDNPSANAILWGGVDPKFYHHPIEYFHVDDPYYWSTKLKSFRIGPEEYFGEKASSFLETDRWADRAPKAIVDTGTTFFTAESGLFGKIMKRLPTASCNEITHQSHPPITFTLQRTDGEPRDFELTHDMYMTQQGDGEWGDSCSPAFMKINIPRQHGPAMVLGEVFLRHFFAVFDRGASQDPDYTGGARLGFAKARHGIDVNKRLHDLTPNQPSFHGMRGSEQAVGDEDGSDYANAR